MNLWPVEHFFPHFLAGSLLISADPAKKWGNNCSTGQRFICTEVTSYIRPEPYKIHLVLRYMDASIQMHFQNEFDSILAE